MSILERPLDQQSHDVVIVGGGIAGSALAVVLARKGISVLVLEKSTRHLDRVRGEFIVPWGVAEAKALGILDHLVEAGGNYTTRSVPYGDGVTHDEAQKRAIDMGAMLPGIKGALNIAHPAACDALNLAAVAAGANLLRGVSNIVVQAGTAPEIVFDHDSRTKRISPRLIVGADGRGSQLAKQLKARYSSDPVHHLLWGMLVDGLDDWPEIEQSIGVAGDICFYVFPQGNGRTRLYAACGLHQRDRFAGPDGPRVFLEAFKCDALSHVRAFSRAKAVGPCHGYPNNDVWLDNPVFEGVVLIGDAAGLNDPSGGQGISIAFKDARLVSEAMLNSSSWMPQIFSGYVEERQERLRRLRFSGRLLAQIRMDFSPEGKERSRSANARLRIDPALGLPLLAFQKGPFAVPERSFSLETWQRILNGP